MQNLLYIYKANICQSSSHPKQEITDDCMGFSVILLVFEHVTQQFLHGSVSNGSVEEQQLYPLRIHKAQRGKEKKQLSEPKHKDHNKIKAMSNDLKQKPFTL